MALERRRVCFEFVLGFLPEKHGSYMCPGTWGPDIQAGLFYPVSLEHILSFSIN